jgi:signal transduction histidine kinase
MANWLRPPQRWGVLLALLTLLAATGLIWLSWRVVSLDKQLDGQRTQQWLEAVADRVSGGFARELASLAGSVPALLDGRTPIPDGAVVVEVAEHGLLRRAGAPLLFTPVVRIDAPPSGSIWDPGEALELRRHDPVGALQAFTALSTSAEPAIRAGALVRMAAIQRKLGRHVDALATYRALASIGAVTILGEPADLIARATECETLATLGRPDELARASDALAHDLAMGRWLIDRGTFEFRMAQLARWTPHRPADEAVALASGIAATWESRGEVETGPSEPRTMSFGDHEVVLVSTATANRMFIVAVSTRSLTESWALRLDLGPISLALLDLRGQIVMGKPPGRDTPSAVRASHETRLPWTIRISTTTSFPGTEDVSSRRQLIFSGFGLLAGVIVVSGYMVSRALQREMAVARLQTDFVSAVSHEFRTPLTAMSHLTDRLQRDSSIPEERRAQYYEALARDTRRLRRFVDTLLDFGRMEAGLAKIQPEPAEISALTAGVVAEFRADPAAGSHEVRYSPPLALPPARVDTAAIGLALWNLLDNAAKYSSDAAPIEVEVIRDGDGIAVRVRDFGQGVPSEERHQIFKKFVRGRAHHASGVRGTGVGLALVDQIARAHGGRVTVDSVVGEGSVFSLWVPCRAS